MGFIVCKPEHWEICKSLWTYNYFKGKNEGGNQKAWVLLVESVQVKKGGSETQKVKTNGLKKTTTKRPRSQGRLDTRKGRGGRDGKRGERRVGDGGRDRDGHRREPRERRAGVLVGRGGREGRQRSECADAAPEMIYG